MSEIDSFIEEVTDEVRRDKLFAAFRKYGWIGILAIVGIVGAASWNEWQKARTEAAAQSFGDALVAALGSDDAGERVKALSAVATDGTAQGALVQAFLVAGEAEKAGDAAGAAAALKAIADNPATPAIYRQLAQLKSVLLAGPGMDAASRDATLATLATPGAPFRTLAEEQQALALLDAGQTDEAVAKFQAISEDSETPTSQKARLGQILTALGVVPVQPVEAAAEVPAATTEQSE